MGLKVCLVCLEEKSDGEEGRGGISTIKVLLSYLLGNIEDGEGIKSDILELSGDCGEVGLCERCGVGAEQLLKLHLELEKVQMRIGYELKLIKGKVRSGGVQEKMKTLGGMEGMMTEGGRKIFGGLKAFQNCVGGEGSDADVPFILLERCDLVGNVLEESSAPKIERVTPEREEEDLDQISRMKNEQPDDDFTLLSLSPTHFDDPEYFETPSPISEGGSETYLLAPLKSASKAKGEIEEKLLNCIDANMSPYILLERCDLVRKVPDDNQTSSPELDNLDEGVGSSSPHDTNPGSHAPSDTKAELPHPKPQKESQEPPKSAIQSNEAASKELKENAIRLADGRFKCKKCQKEVSCRPAFYRHFHAIHLRTGRKCLFCNESFVHYSSLRLHRRKCQRNQVPDQNYPTSSPLPVDLDPLASEEDRCVLSINDTISEHDTKTEAKDSQPNSQKKNPEPQKPAIRSSQEVLKEIQENAIELARGRFLCKKCEKILSSRGAFNQHFHTIHLRTELKCHLCDKSFFHPSSLYLHRRKCQRPEDSKSKALKKIKENAIELAEGRFQCKMCEKDFSSRTTFYSHFHSTHLRTERKCRFCDKVFVVYTTLRVHRIKCQKKQLRKKGLASTVPDNSRTSSPRLDDPNTSSAETDCKIPANCPPSSSRLNDSTARKAASEEIKENGIELAEGRIQCKKCQIELSSRHAFYLHFRALHLITEHKCPFCNLPFVQFSRLRLHRVKCQRKQKRKGKRKVSEVPADKLEAEHPHLDSIKIEKSDPLKSPNVGVSSPPGSPAETATHSPTSFKAEDHPESIKIEIKKLPKHRKGLLMEMRKNAKTLPGGRVQCKKCLKKISSLGSFHQHYHAIHLKTEHKCRFCTRSFVHLSSLRRHRYNCLENQAKAKSERKKPRKYKCSVPNCARSFPSPSKLLGHYKLIHPEEEPPKEVLQRLEKFKMDAKTKEEELANISEKYENVINEGSERFKCKECSGMFASFKSFSKHYREIHIKGEFKCDNCNMTFVTRGKLHRHRPICKNSKSLQCKLCGKSFGSSCSLHLHRKSVHLSDTPFMCDICGRWFATNSLLTNHRQDCNGGRWGSGIIQKIKENGHVLEGGAVKCKLCPKEFENFAIFSRHYRVYHSRIFQCKFCKKVLSRHSDQIKHEKVCKKNPQPQAKFQCDKCPKSYADRRNLKRHFQINHVETFSRFICDQCPSSFIEQYALKKHVENVHEGTLPRFACQYCAKSSIYKKTIIMHELKCPDRPL